MTKQSRDGNRHSAFGEWLGKNESLDSRMSGAALSIVDIDWCIHQYATWTDRGRSRLVQNMMFVEEKTFCADIRQNMAQWDTISSAHQTIVNGGQKDGEPKRVWVKSKRTGNDVMVRNFGYHLLRFSHSGPVDSVPPDGWIEWYWKRITVGQLEQLLRFELSPITLRERDERSHHGGKRQKHFNFNIASATGKTHN